MKQVRNKIKNQKTVVLIVSDGIVEAKEIPKGVKVVVRDYDIEGYDREGEEDHFHKDEGGSEYFEYELGV